MFKKTLIMSVATAGLACSVAFAANGGQPTGSQIGVVFASDLGMIGEPTEFSLINDVKVGVTMFNWDKHFALQAGFGGTKPDDSDENGSKFTFDISFNARKLFQVGDTPNYMTAGLGVEYSTFQKVEEDGDDNPSDLKFALEGGFMRYIDDLHSVFAVTTPVFESRILKDSAGDSRTSYTLFSGAEVAWTYLFR